MSMQAFAELSLDELDRIEHRVEAATAGPWISYIAGRDAEVETSRIELGACNELGTFKSIELVGGSVADQDFIASARQDVPRLIREVLALRARLSALLSEQDDGGVRVVASAGLTEATLHSARM